MKTIGRKGQSALEYLMTYGWAILIIIIVGGVLYYYGVFSPGKLVGESKIGFSRVYVDTWGVSGNELNLIFENRAGKDINITTVYINDAIATSSDLPLSNYLIAGDKNSGWITVTIPASSEPDSGEAYQFEVAIEYVYKSIGGAFNSTGTLSGTA